MDLADIFEISLAFARTPNEPTEEWTPAILYITSSSTVIAAVNALAMTFPVPHYLEDWLTIMIDADQPPYLTRELGGIWCFTFRTEMSAGWRASSLSQSG